jgi:hypothetical protein
MNTPRRRREPVSCARGANEECLVLGGRRDGDGACCGTSSRTGCFSSAPSPRSLGSTPPARRRCLVSCTPPARTQSQVGDSRRGRAGGLGSVAVQAARRASSSGTRTRRRWEGEAAAARGCGRGDRPARSARSMGCRRPFQNRRFGVRREKEWWDPQVGK